MIYGGKDAFIIVSPEWLEKDPLDALPSLRPFLEFAEISKRSKATAPHCMPPQSDAEDMNGKKFEEEQPPKTALSPDRKNGSHFILRIFRRRTSRSETQAA